MRSSTVLRPYGVCHFVVAIVDARSYFLRMRYNRGVHHRHSIRMRGYDYAGYGAYFVTICTHQREMLLTDRLVRDIVSSAWHDLARRFGVTLDEFVVMPNHVHGVIWITRATAVGAQLCAEPDDIAPIEGFLDSSEDPSKHCAAPLRMGVARGSLGLVVRAFKSHSAKRINRLRKTRGAPVWQRNYWDRIIRDEGELNRVRQYILDNPLKWPDDPNHPDNVVRA
jgi:REP element-mobilizing transposase RayT